MIGIVTRDASDCAYHLIKVMLDNPLFFLSLITSLLTCTAVGWSAPDKPNLILISVDSLRPDHMGLYGYSRDTTPNIDLFAKDAVVFTNYFATSYLTPISEISVHTGCYPFTTGVINFNSLLSGKMETLAEVLKRNGYRTAAFGSSPEFFIHPTLKAAFSRGFDHYFVPDKNDLAWTNKRFNGRDELDIRDAILWARNIRQKDEPFFLWLAVGSAHWPYGQDEPAHFSDPAYDGFFKVETAPPGSPQVPVFVDIYGHIYKNARYDNEQNMIPEDVETGIKYVIDRYDDGIVKTDRILKEVFDFLADPAVSANTVIVIQSEHGEDFGEHGYIAHYDITDTQTRVPLIIKMPQAKPGRINALISGVDIYPTILEALGLTSSRVDGESFYALLTDQAGYEPRTEIYLTRTPLWERLVSGLSHENWLMPFREKDDLSHYHDMAIRTEEWKLVHRLARDILDEYSWYGWLTGEPPFLPEYELYHLPSDPLELKNIYSPDDPVAAELRGKLLAWEEKMHRSLPEAPTRDHIQPYF